MTIDEGRRVEIARAAQALAPRVAQSIIKMGRIPSFDIRPSSFVLPMVRRSIGA